MIDAAKDIIDQRPYHHRRQNENICGNNSIKIAIRANMLPPSAVLICIIMLTTAAGSNDLSANEGYTLNIDLPAEILDDVKVVLSMPGGYTYVTESLHITGSTDEFLESLSGPNDGNQPLQITWSFGQVDNSNDQDIVIQLKAVVSDTASNQDGTILQPARATLTWINSQGQNYSGSAEMSMIKIVEPDLDIEKKIEPIIGRNDDTVTCSISIRHNKNSHSDAFDVDLTDNLPAGLTYFPDSMEVISGPAVTTFKSGPDSLSWHFDTLNRDWSGNQEILIRYKITIGHETESEKKLISRSYLNWSSTPGDNPEDRHYCDEADASVFINPLPPKFNITIADYPDPVEIGGILTYDIDYRNDGGNAKGVLIEDTYDEKVEFRSANPSPDQETNNKWTIGELGKGGSGTITIKVQVSSEAKEEEVIENEIRVSSDSGMASKSSANTIVKSNIPLLLINKETSNDIIRPGGDLNYTITYTNEGKFEATNVTITDIIDSHLYLDPESPPHPMPSQIWTEDDGTHLYWNSSALKLESFEPGQSGQIELKVRLPQFPEHPDIDKVYNKYRIDSNQTSGSFRTKETFVVHSLFVRKTAEKDSYSEGEIINYTIIYGNELAIDAEDAVITDHLPDVEYLTAEPAPSEVNGSTLYWRIGTIPANNTGYIKLYVGVKETNKELKYFDGSSVYGEGYVNVNRMLSTSTKPDKLTNYVYITANYLGIKDNDSSSATIKLVDAIGTEYKLREHGSGTYYREDQTKMLSKNKIIEVETNLSARYDQTSVSLPGDRMLEYDSKWHESLDAINQRTSASIAERYLYATRLDRLSSLKMDENGTTLTSETDFHGAGSTGFLKRSEDENGMATRETPALESRERYLGSFKIYQNMDEYGKNAVMTRSAAGYGLVAAERVLGTSQRSYESGSGSFQVEDDIQTDSSYIYKSIKALQGELNYSFTPNARVDISNKWKEGISSKAPPGAFIGEEFSHLDYLNKKTVATGLNEMKTEAEFFGKADFTVFSSDSSSVSESEDAYQLEQSYMGKYRVTRNVTLGGVARFARPHISVSKAMKEDLYQSAGSTVEYVITVLNDGNSALGPIYVQDIFPPGTEYLYSSLRPSEIAPGYANWTLVSLGIGVSSTIELKLNLSSPGGNLVNRVQVAGGYEDQWITASNYSALELDWLACCPPEIFANKTASIVSEHPTVVKYRILLQNQEKYAMAVTVEDQLPNSMKFLNASTPPSSYTSSEVSWNIVDLEPRETRAIDYWVQATRNGVFINRARIEGHSIERPGSISAAVYSRIEINDLEDDSQSGSIDWMPPKCFGLNCTPTWGSDEWIPCDSCAAE